MIDSKKSIGIAIATVIAIATAVSVCMFKANSEKKSIDYEDYDDCI